MRELIISATRDANFPYLAKVLARVPEDKHSQITALFETHMAFLADYCMAGYGGRGTLTEAFICGLHKALFPGDYKQALMTTPEGEVVYMVPGKYKRFNNGGESYLYPNGYIMCIVPEDVPETMAKVVNTLNTALAAATDEQQIRDAIFFFVVDFLMIHPFGDANGRVAYMLADLLAIREGLPAFFFTSIKEKDLPAFCRALELVREKRDLTPIYEVLEKYSFAVSKPCIEIGR
jgi:fido (protein-threonine AMPylation protein)